MAFTTASGSTWPVFEIRANPERKSTSTVAASPTTLLMACVTCREQKPPPSLRNSAPSCAKAPPGALPQLTRPLSGESMAVAVVDLAPSGAKALRFPQVFNSVFGANNRINTWRSSSSLAYRSCRMAPQNFYIFYNFLPGFEFFVGSAAGFPPDRSWSSGQTDNPPRRVSRKEIPWAKKTRRHATPQQPASRDESLPSGALLVPGPGVPGSLAPGRAPALGGFLDEVWEWQGRRIRYLRQAASGSERRGSLILIHGFGASADYYRDNIPAFAADGWEVFAVDLLGFGGSEKPVGDLVYSIELWSQQVKDFAKEIVADRSYALAGNSVGSLVAATTAASNPDVRGLLLYNIAAGMNNKFTMTDDLTPWTLKLFAIPLFSTLDALLGNDGFSKWFFERTKTEENVAQTLKSVYVNDERVDKELVQSILRPADDPNALEVFVRILTGYPGTTPDKLVPDLNCPIKFIWGDDDPFTPLDGPYGSYFREMAEDESVPLMTISVVNGGHCPHDDNPDATNEIAVEWLRELV
eukprot:scaffold4289_cov246-Pinguiococcus_pyrenoidosus.AAC.1